MEDEEVQEDVEMIVGMARQIATMAKKRPSTTLFSMQESMKEKLMQQQKLKEQRLQRYQELQLPHRHICDMVAMYWGIEPNEVMEGVIDEPEFLNTLQNLLDKGRNSCALFYYQDGPPYSVESGRHNPASKDNIKRIYVTDGTLYPLVEKAVVAYKFRNVAIDLKNINDVLQRNFTNQ